MNLCLHPAFSCHNEIGVPLSKAYLTTWALVPAFAASSEASLPPLQPAFCILRFSPSVVSTPSSILLLFFLRFYLFIFTEGKRGRKRGREILMCERNIDQLPLALTPAPQPGTACKRECALVGNWIFDLSLFRKMLSPLSHARTVRAGILTSTAFPHWPNKTSQSHASQISCLSLPFLS